MRIIRKGALPQERMFRSVCLYCNCEFEFTQCEAYTFHDQRDGSYVQINCPTCKRPVTASL
jgi:hypothetical protein